MADITKLKQTRGTIKGTLTNIKKFADERVNEPPELIVVNREQIETRLDKLEKAWNEFHDVNDSIAVGSGVSQQTEVDAFEDSFYETEAILKRLLKARKPSVITNQENNCKANRTFFDEDKLGLHSDVRLPRIQIESFAGVILNGLHFTTNTLRQYITMNHFQA